MIFADTIYINGKILTVDKEFTVAEALAITGNLFTSVGKNENILCLAGDKTKIIDLHGDMVIPGLNDSHLHPTMAAVSELKNIIPNISTKDQLLYWISEEVSTKDPGQWIIHPKLFITRTKERHYPSLKELDEISPNNPVFLNGSYSGMVNTYALQSSNLLKGKLLSGILTNSDHQKPTGIIRPEIFPLLKYKEKKIYDKNIYSEALESMLHRYNRVGITSVTDGKVKSTDILQYLELKEANRLSTRVNLCLTPDFQNSNKSIESLISELDEKLFKGDEFLHSGTIKIFLDGGILTGTASINKPWGEKCQKIFGFDGTNYYGHLNFTQEEVTAIAVAVVKKGLKFTAHCIGDKALSIMLTAFEEANKIRNIDELRWSVIHANFFDSASIKRAAKLGIIVEFQIAWLYKDATYIEYILGKEYLDMFLPLRSMIDSNLKLAGGSDHMVKFDSISSINPYNPFLSMQVMVTRKVEDGRIINKNEAITREEALRLYTMAGAYSTGDENIKGSIETGKLADMLIIDTDYLNCFADRIENIKVKTTILGGKVVYQI